MAAFGLVQGRANEPRAFLPAWPGYVAAMVLSVVGIGVTALAPYGAPPVKENPIGLVFSPFSTEQANVQRVLSLAQDLRLVDSQYDGRVLFVQLESTRAERVYEIPGLLHAFDAVAAGCHGLGTDMGLQPRLS